jgi:hypothetical protein
MKENHLPFVILMNTHLVVLKIKHCGKDLSLNKQILHLHLLLVGFTFEMLKAKINLKVKQTWKLILEKNIVYGAYNEIVLFSCAFFLPTHKL